MARAKTAVDEIAERYLDTYARLDPCAATELGITGHDDDITDYSPDGVATRAEAARATLRELDGAKPVDDVDVVTIAAMRERLGVAVELHDAGLDLGELNVIASPLQSMRDVFDLMATDTAEDWAVISARLARIPERVENYAAALRARVAGDDPPAIRQVQRGIAQTEQIQKLFVDMVSGAPDSAPVDELRERAAAAADAYLYLGTVLRDDVAPRARKYDACGRDAYRLLSRAFLGTEADLDESYEWGLNLLDAIVAEQESIAQELYPGATVAETLRRLDEEPRYVITGTDALQAWMQDLSDRAVDSLAGTHFDIDGPLRRLECRIAPTQTGGIYYTGPSETGAVRAECGGRCRPGSTSSTRGRKPPRCSTRACPVTICRSGARSPWPTVSTGGAAWDAGCRATVRAGHCTPNASWPNSAGSTTRATAWACSTRSGSAPRAWSSTSVCTAGSRHPTVRCGTPNVRGTS